MKQLEDMEDEEVSSEVPFDLIPYPYNQVPETFGRDEPQYPELRKLLMRTLDILTRGAGVLAPYAPRGKLVYYDVASIDIDPDSAILRVSDWQGANEIMNFLTNAHLIRWDEDMEAYELARKPIQESVDEEEGPSEIPPDLQPYPFNRISPNLEPEFRQQLLHVLDILREPNSELIVYWRQGRGWSVDYIVLKAFTRSGLCISKEKITKRPGRLFQYLNNEIKVLKWEQGTSSQLQGYVYHLKKNTISEAVDEEESEGDVSKFVPVDDTLNVRIIGNTFYPNGWYEKYRGQVLRVERTPRSANNADHPDWEFYRALDHTGFILTRDCEVVPPNFDEDEPETDMRKVRVLKPFPLNLLPSKLPALFRNVVELLRDPAWMIEPDQVRRYGELVNVINLINTQTGEIQQLPQAKGEEIFNTLRDVGALVSHPEYSKNYVLKRIHESVEETEDSGDVSSFDRPRHTILPEQIAESPTYFDAWKIFDSKYNELMDINRDLEPDESEYAPVIPTGHGQFERWWLGLDDQGSNEWPSPFGQITVQDIEKLEKEEPFEIFGLFSNIFYNHSLSELDPTIMEAICKAIMRSPEKKPSIRRLLGFQKDMVDFLDGPFAAQMSQDVKDLILSQNNTPQAVKERKIVASIAEDPAKQEALIKKAIADEKSHRRRAE